MWGYKNMVWLKSRWTIKLRHIKINRLKVVKLKITIVLTTFSLLILLRLSFIVHLDFNHTVFLYPHIHFISNLILSIIVWQVPEAVDKFVCAPDDGWRYHPKHVEQFPDINKLCNTAFCWVCMGIYLRGTDPWTSNWLVFVIVVYN